jgi:hypothetical protein
MRKDIPQIARRNRIAEKAMAAIIMRSKYLPQVTAEQAYEYADAMIKESEKPPKP